MVVVVVAGKKGTSRERESGRCDVIKETRRFFFVNFTNTLLLHISYIQYHYYYLHYRSYNLYKSLMKKHGRFSAKKIIKGVDGRIKEKKKKRLTASVYARKKETKVRLLQTTTRLFFLYVGVNPTLIKRLRYVTIC